MTVAAEHASEVRARGLSPLWACSAVAFLIVSLVVGVLAGPVDLGSEPCWSRPRHDFTSLASPPRSRRPRKRFWEIRVPRVVLRGPRRRDARARGCDVPGRLPQSARGSVLGVAAGAGLGATIAIAYLPDGLRGSGCSRSPRSSVARSRYDVRRGSFGAAGARCGDADPRRRHRDGVLHRLADVRPAAEPETLQEVYSWILGNIPSTGWSTSC